MTSDAITDLADVPITFLNFSIAESTDGPVFVVRVPGTTSRYLAAEDNPTVRVLGRKHLTSDAFVDLHTSPIDLTPYNGVAVDFDIKLHANAVSGIVFVGVLLKVTFNP